MKKAILVLAFLSVAIPVIAATVNFPINDPSLNGGQVKHIVGRNTDIDISAEDFIDNGANFNWPTSEKTLQILSTSVKDIGGKKATSTLTVVDYNQMLGAKNSATITFTNTLAQINGKRITVNGNNLTENTQWHNGNSLGETATAFAAAVNAMTNGATFSASATGNVVTIQYDTNGDTTGALTLATNDANGIILSSATLTGGEDLLTLTVNGRTFVAGTTFVPVTSNAATASAIATYLSANGFLASKLTATASGRVVTITAASEGTAGNSITTSSNDSDSLTAANATLKLGKADVNGANLITIEGLNGGYLYQTEDVTLNGTGFAVTTNRYLRLNNAYISEAGSNGNNIGTVTIKQNGTNLMMAKIAATENKTFNSTYTIPSGKAGYVVQQNYSVLTASPLTTVDYDLRVRPYNGAFKSIQTDAIANGTAFINKTIALPTKISGKSDIIIRGSSGANNTSTIGGFDLIEAND